MKKWRRCVPHVMDREADQNREGVGSKAADFSK
jgi:hypothetical protein